MGQQNRTEHERSRIGWGRQREWAKEKRDSRNSEIKRRMSNCGEGSHELEKFRTREEVRRARML